MRFTLAACAVLSLGATDAHASLIAQDLFNNPSYSIGTQVYPSTTGDYGVNTARSGFTNGWQNGGAIPPYYTNTPFTITDTLTYNGLATPGFGATSGQAVASAPAISFATRSFVSNTATTDLWMSFLIQPNGVTPTARTPQFWGGFSLNRYSTIVAQAGIPGTYGTNYPNGTTTYSLQTAGGSVISSSTKTAVSGQTALIVVDLNYTSPTTSTAYLWVNPTLPTTSLSTATADTSASVNFAVNQITGVGWTNTLGWTFAALRLGTTAADVVPETVFEPASLAVLLSGVAGLGLVRRRRAHA